MNDSGIWAIQEQYAGLLSQGGELTPVEAAAQRRVSAGRQSSRSSSAGVAVIALHGILGQKPTFLGQVMGWSSAAEITGQLRAAMADPTVGSVVLDIDSPGGSVFGIQELHDVMMSYRGRKPITAVANSTMASAAYWIASAASEIVVTPGGVVGSIGVIQQHDDISGAQEQAGVRTTLITAGRKKASGHPFGPLDEESLSDAQAKVNTYYRMFVDSVARGRGVSASAVRAGFGEGDVVLAQDAKRLGMVDRIEPLGAVVGRASASYASKRASLWELSDIDGLDDFPASIQQPENSGKYCYRLATVTENETPDFWRCVRATELAAQRLGVFPAPAMVALRLCSADDPRAVEHLPTKLLAWCFPKVGDKIFVLMDAEISTQSLITSVGHELWHLAQGIDSNHDNGHLEAVCDRFGEGLARSLGF